MGIVLWVGAGDLSDWLEASARERLFHLTWLIASGSAAYVVSIIAVGVRPRHLKVITDV
jgi:putative peptidoglycan lipid II flippase